MVKKHHCIQHPLCVSAAKVTLEKGWETTLAKVSGVGRVEKSISVLRECLKIVLLWFKIAKEKWSIEKGSTVLTLDPNVSSGFSWFLPEAVQVHLQGMWVKLVLAGTGDKGMLELIRQVCFNPSSKFFPKIKGNLTDPGAVLILLSAQIGGKGSALISEKP